MKIHPHDLSLREFLDALSEDHRRLFRHLLGCQACQERLPRALSRKSTALAARVARILDWRFGRCDYDASLRSSMRLHPQRFSFYARERAEAKGLLCELLTHPADRRVLILENHPRFHTWGLLEALIEKGREASYAEPARGGDLSRMALRLADHLDIEIYGAERIEDLRARAWADIGSARRALSDLSGAATAMATAAVHLRRGTGDLLERANLLELRSSLLRAQRRLDQALRALQRALAIFLEYGDTHRAGRALLRMSTVHHAAGAPEKAIPLLYRAIEFIDSSEEPLLVLAAWHNLIDDLADAGRYLEAHGLFSRAQPIYRRFPDPSTQSRRKWVQGKIALGLGRVVEAEVLLQAARDGFLKTDVAYDAALVSLDLAAVYARKGRTADLKSLAETILPVFVSHGIHREALGALLLLRQAIAAESATVELVVRVAGYLKRAQHDPELRFEGS